MQKAMRLINQYKRDLDHYPEDAVKVAYTEALEDVIRLLKSYQEKDQYKIINVVENLLLKKLIRRLEDMKP
jgi:hypothetical protein